VEGFLLLIEGLLGLDEFLLVLEVLLVRSRAGIRRNERRAGTVGREARVAGVYAARIGLRAGRRRLGSLRRLRRLRHLRRLGVLGLLVLSRNVFWNQVEPADRHHREPENGPALQRLPIPP